MDPRGQKPLVIFIVAAKLEHLRNAECSGGESIGRIVTSPPSQKSMIHYPPPLPGKGGWQALKMCDTSSGKVVT